MANRRSNILERSVLVYLLLATQCLAQAGTIEAAARKGIDAGNQAWVDGMKAGEVSLIAGTYAADALDCGPTGDCIRGRAAIERHLTEQFAKLGRALSASAISGGAVQQGDFVYEWGRAEASFAHGKRQVDRYLTVWRRETDGGWKIFRNLVIPDERRR